MNSSAVIIKKCVEEFASFESLKRKKQKEKVFKKGILWDFSDQITAGWYIADLFDVTNLITCGVAKRPEYVEEGIPFLSAQNARPFKTNLNKIRYIDENTFKKITVGGKPEKGDILYTRVGNCGEAATVPYDFNFGVYVSLTLIKPNSLFLYSDYLTAFLNSRFGIMQASQGAIGIGLKNLNVDNVRRYKIPLPPISEQKRIVEKLDSLLAQVDTIQQRLNNLPNIIKRFRQSVLAAAVSGKLTEQWRVVHKFDIKLSELKLVKELLITKKEIKNDLVFETTEGTFAIPESWEFIKLQSLANKVTDGEHKTPKREESGRFLLSARNVRDGYIDTSNVDFVGDDEYAKLRKRCNPNKGDILISCSGSVGRISLVDKDDEYVMVRSAALVKTLPEYVSNKFLMYVLQSPHIQKQIVDASKSTAQANLFLGPIKNLFIPYLPIEEQTEIVRLVEQYFALADTLEKNLANAKQRVDNLTQSILAKAFKGELVPQDPNDEPADKLLERIKAARLEAEKLEKAAKKAAKASKAKKN
ncbi:restriction endonuclease subunit S [Thalassotalea profundi]|uniref:Type I restriction modification DNA specificity domain-containing protein n=1 Tax=Thalassotalea profundi TaxID=2036687 RepID=A0ABQ3IJY3_9GAMM|nr:restriction endonuclease subunit S [Thalassotalea profundi]GHE85920.1 hypothetical protein GCM10011501_13870 [Thalassotalea profundi]